MLKFLLIVGLVLYVIYKIGTLFFRAGAASQHYRNHQRRDFDPNERRRQTKKTDFKGGEYIDYEEIK